MAVLVSASMYVALQAKPTAEATHGYYLTMTNTCMYICTYK